MNTDNTDSAPEAEPTPRTSLDWTPDVDWCGDPIPADAALIDMVKV